MPRVAYLFNDWYIESMSRFNKLEPRPEHLEALKSCLAGGELLTPHEIVKRSKLSLTATYGAIEALERDKELVVIRQDKTPKMQVRLSDKVGK